MGKFVTDKEEAATARLIARINRKDWWHVPPRDPLAYRKRGKFYSSMFGNAEFWGRPLDIPEKVTVRNPVVGDEPYVQTVLFGGTVPEDNTESIEWRFELDARMKEGALGMGYDAIVILSQRAYTKMKTTGNLPLNIELNILEPVH